MNLNKIFIMLNIAFFSLSLEASEGAPLEKINKSTGSTEGNIQAEIAVLLKRYITCKNGCTPLYIPFVVDPRVNILIQDISQVKSATCVNQCAFDLENSRLAVQRKHGFSVR